MAWAAIVVAAIEIVGSLFKKKQQSDEENRLKQKAQSDAQNALESSNIQAAKDAGYVMSGAGYIPPFSFQNTEHAQLSAKAKEGRFGGAALTTSEQKKLEDYTATSKAISSKSESVYNAKSNSVTSPSYGFFSGLGSASNPLYVPNVDINTTSKKGLSPFVVVGLLAGGAGVVYYIVKKK